MNEFEVTRRDDLDDLVDVGRQVLIHKIGGCWESISRKSNMSMDPLPLKSNAEAWLPGDGVVPYA